MLVVWGHVGGSKKILHANLKNWCLSNAHFADCEMLLNRHHCQHNLHCYFKTTPKTHTKRRAVLNLSLLVSKNKTRKFKTVKNATLFPLHAFCCVQATRKMPCHYSNLTFEYHFCDSWSNHPIWLYHSLRIWFGFFWHCYISSTECTLNNPLLQKT